MILELMNESFSGFGSAAYMAEPEPLNDDTITPDSIGMQEIVSESQAYFERLDEANLLAEGMILVGTLKGRDMSQLSENVVTDVFKKIADGIKTLWKKVTTWFANLFKSISISILDVKKALKGVRDKLSAKDMDKFEYTSYDWADNTDSVGKDICDNLTAGITDDENTIKKHLTSANTLSKSKPSKTDEDLKSGISDTNDQTAKIDKQFLDKKKKSLVGKLIEGSDQEMSMEKAKDIIKKKFNMVSETKKTGLASSDSDKMIAFLEGFDKNKNLIDMRTESSNAFKDSLKVIEDTQKEIEDLNSNIDSDDASKKWKSARFNYRIALIKQHATLMHSKLAAFDTLMGYVIELEKAKFAQYRSIIASAVRYSPAKK